MPERSTLDRALRDKRQGKAPSTQAGEFVREEIEHIRHGVHGAKSTAQAVAIGLSKARRAGIGIPDYGKKKKSGRQRSSSKKRGVADRSSRQRADSALRVLRRESTKAASRGALSRFDKASARKWRFAKSPPCCRKSSSNEESATKNNN